VSSRHKGDIAVTTITITDTEERAIALVEELHAGQREIIADRYDELWAAERQIDDIDEDDEEGFRAAVAALGAARSAYREALV
jgi:hypothetical protein